jgi:hypothetical protein
LIASWKRGGAQKQHRKARSIDRHRTTHHGEMQDKAARQPAQAKEMWRAADALKRPLNRSADATADNHQLELFDRTFARCVRAWRVYRAIVRKRTARGHSDGSISKMDQSVALLNIEHFQRRLAEEKNEARRQTILALLVEEKAKLAAATVASREGREES